MNELIKTVENYLLSPAQMDIEKARQYLPPPSANLDLADIYLQQHTQESWSLEDSKVKTGGFGEICGMGLRALRGETTAFASCDVISEKAFADMSQVAQTAKTYGGTFTMGKLAPPTASPLRFSDDNPINATDSKSKIALLEDIDRIARAADPNVENVFASVALAFDVVMILRNDGGVAADIRPMARLSVTTIINKDGRRESGSSGCGGRVDFCYFDQATARRVAKEAVEEARQKLIAKPAPAGIMPVVLGPGWAGIILHEAVGHGLEGDFNRKRQSTFSGRIGERVAAKGVTVIDAGNLEKRRGSLSCDDEGTPTQATTLIEDGILRAYMQDATNAKLMNVSATGNGRRESYAHPPMPRMTNTFMSAGNYAPDDIVSSVKRGLYAESFSGGEVDITNGNFVFVCSRARLIENGKLGATVKGATIIGNGPAIMPLVSMVGDDFALDPGIGACGKNGQWVPVGVGQPTIKVDALNVGGESE